MSMHCPESPEHAGAASGRTHSTSSPDFSPLDNPIWNSLITGHASLALGDGLARRFPPAIGPLSGMAEYTAQGFEALRRLTGPDGVVAVFQQQLYEPQPGWTLVRDGRMFQMICLEETAPDAAILPPGTKIVRLTAEDNSEMVALARLTEPGPFFDRTRELGTFFGIRREGRLVAMAGERLRFPEFVEVSAVCTHPEARGLGYARLLTAKVARHIRQGGRTPMLHLFAANTPALRVYESLGFTVRRNLELAVLKNEG